MSLLDKVFTNVNLCEVQVAFSGVPVASVIEGWQPFYNSTFENADFQKAYASLSSIDFKEQSQESKAGSFYKQQISFRFPNSDQFRADRIALFQKLKFIKLKQTNGLEIVIGRNDYFQNAKPKIVSKQNHQLCEIEVTVNSIFPSGYTPGQNFSFGLPTLIPLTLVP